MAEHDSEVDARIAQLDLETKVRLLTGASMFTLRGEPLIGLAPMAFSDGPTGVRGLVFVGGTASALLPNATLIASAWSEDVAYDVGQLLADEAERQHIHVVLGPTVNLHRSPLGGRLFEAYSEDPLLTGRLAAAYVKGLQARGIGACLKHLVANEAETDRHTVNNVVDEATLREVYLLPFEIAVEDADPWSIMAAYNDVNGVPATEQGHVNTEIVKGEWGYPGLLMSDWFATKSAAPAANGGLDLVMPGPEGPWGTALVDAVRAGEVEESVVDEHVRRLLRLAERVGAHGQARSWRESLPEPAAPERREQLLRLAARGMTVLTNDGVLPLSANARVALIGRHALETFAMGGGSASVNPPHQISIAEGMAEALGADRVTVVDGVDVRTRAVPADPQLLSDPVTGEHGIHVVAYAADGTVLVDRHVPDAMLTVGFDDDLGEPPARVRLRARVAGTGPREVGVIGVGRWTVSVGGETHEVGLDLETSDVGESILRPPGWVTVVDADAGLDVQAEVRAPEGGFGRLAIAARPAPPRADDVVAAAPEAAASADVAVVVVGLTEEQESEAVDKASLALPGAQDAMVSAVAAAAKRTVVVVNAATPVLMPWAHEVDAIVWAGIPGQEAGRAVSAALLGEIEPAGRLVTSFPVADGASPAWDVTPTGGVLEYAEGPFVGYRGYAAGRAPTPAFWFGHGLGYATWEYGTPSVSRAGDEVVVEVSVTNTGGQDSREVVQVYLEPAETDQPVRLVGWSGVEVGAGATAVASVRCDPRMWRRWDAEAGEWARLSPGGTLLLARGLGDVRSRIPLGD